MVKLEKIPSDLGRFKIVALGDEKKAIVKDEICYYSNIRKMNVYQETVNEKVIYWIIAKSFKEINVLRICESEILLLLSLKGTQFPEGTEVSFLFEERYFLWDISSLEYLESTSNFPKESSEVPCYMSRKIDEVSIKAKKKDEKVSK